jgi:hypothetical protein
MWFLGQFSQKDRLRNMAAPLSLICNTLLISLILSGCGGASDASQDDVIDRVINEVTIQPTIEESINFADESYTLLALTGYESSGLQVYWPTDSDIPAAQQASFQLLIPKLNKLFTEQNFAFSQQLSSGVPPLYKKIILNPLSPAVDDVAVGEFSFTFAGESSIVVMFDVDNVLDNETFNTLLIELANAIYQSERLKYQDESSVLDRLVSRGLVLHFLQQNLTVDEFAIVVDIASSELSVALAQIKLALDDNDLIGNWFTKDRLSEQTTANALGYYLAAQHFSFYSGSDAANSFAVNSELFSPWLDKTNNTEKKSEQYVRTGNVPDQIAIEELARQANLYQGSYFIEGLNHEKLIALSFDDGPSQYTTQILDVLEQAQVPASFFGKDNT